MTVTLVVVPGGSTELYCVGCCQLVRASTLESSRLSPQAARRAKEEIHDTSIWKYPHTFVVRRPFQCPHGPSLAILRFTFRNLHPLIAQTSRTRCARPHSDLLPSQEYSNMATLLRGRPCDGGGGGGKERAHGLLWVTVVWGERGCDFRCDEAHCNELLKITRGYREWVAVEARPSVAHREWVA